MRKIEMLPMNLQYFAEEPEPVKDEPGAEPKEEVKEEPKEQPKDEKNLNDQLQSALVELAKVRRQLDKTSSEAAEYRKKWKESMTEAEQASMEKAEAQARRDEEFESMKRKIAINDLVSNYMERDFTRELATKAAEAYLDGDTATLNDIEKQVDTAKKKQWEAEFIKNIPEIRSGMGGSQSITKEQFDKMSLIDKSKLRRENKAEYDRLIAL